MDENELINNYLCLQNEFSKLVADQYKASLIHNYFFAGEKLIKLNKDRMMGSGVILSIADLNGKLIVEPIMIKDGLSKESINSLLDDFQYSYNKATEFLPIEKRL